MQKVIPETTGNDDGDGVYIGSDTDDNNDDTILPTKRRRLLDSSPLSSGSDEFKTDEMDTSDGSLKGAKAKEVKAKGKGRVVEPKEAKGKGRMVEAKEAKGKGKVVVMEAKGAVGRKCWRPPKAR